jgi:ligand-binding SRPBCC domain-containing protein
MAVHTLQTIQKIPVSLAEAWNFFSSPENLKVITPNHLGFKVLSQSPRQKMYAGQIIEYTVKPLLNVPMYWMTEITHVQDQQFFVDEQRFGPYKMWHHQHHFTGIEGGVEMIDLVHYKIPLGWLGDIANTAFVKSQLQNIFSFRFKKVEELFGVWPGQTNVVLFK